MISLAVPPTPPRIRLLPGFVVQRHLTGAVLHGEEALPVNTLDGGALDWEDSLRAEGMPVRDLIDEAMSRFADGLRTQADAWLAPRLHATLRITRREASDPRLWDYLALRLAPDYVHWRHQPMQAHSGVASPVNASRYSGPFHTQTFSRLWWAAELFRDGSDYGPAMTACGNQDMLNSVLRLEIILHRPVAQTFVALLQKGVVRTGREVNALAAAVNAAASTLSYEALAHDDGADFEAYNAWIDNLASAPPVSFTRRPEGPDDGQVDLDGVDVLVPLFGELFTQAPVRGRTGSVEV